MTAKKVNLCSVRLLSFVVLDMAGKQAIKKTNKAANKSKQAASKKGNDKATKKPISKPGSKNAKSKDPMVRPTLVVMTPIMLTMHCIGQDPRLCTSP